MPLLFVDANVYLPCFSPEGRAIVELLPGLEAQKAHLLVTEQVVGEVVRNKAKFVQRFFKNYAQQVGEVREVNIPNQFFPNALHAPLEEWKEKTKQGKEQVEAFKAFLKEAEKQIVELVVRSQDPVSQRMAPLFADAVPATQDQLEAARKRKELGNPPGKPSDPVGDELSWEQLLAQQERWEDGLWLVSNDNDFYACEKSTELSPFLHDELRNRLGAQPTVRCFRMLAQALQAFAAEHGDGAADAPPADEVLKAAEAAEQRFTATSGVFGFPGAPLLTPGAPAVLTPTGIQILPSGVYEGLGGYGGLGGGFGGMGYVVPAFYGPTGIQIIYPTPPPPAAEEEDPDNEAGANP